MRGDFSRYTFDPKKRYSGVWMQQGRVQLDSDWNEQQAINRHRAEEECRDVVGRSGAPSANPGFKITIDRDGNLCIGKGRYYVDGILCENGDGTKDIGYIKYKDQADLPGAPDISTLLSGADYGVVYLDVWHRDVTAIDDPQIKEKALGGADTTTRTKVVWQVKVLPIKLEPSQARPDCDSELFWKRNVFLNAKTKYPEASDEKCALRPNGGYHGLENQLYRVEIHKGGPLGLATFKWSRDNGSIEIPVIGEIAGGTVPVRNVGAGILDSFKDGTIVEIVDDRSDLNPYSDLNVSQSQPRPLFRVKGDPDAISNTILIEPQPDPASVRDPINPRLRRWDSEEIQVEVPSTNEGWIALGDEGIEVKFSTGGVQNDIFKTGDFWLIPARAATGELEWPPYDDQGENPIAQSPLGVEHHYARLAEIGLDGRSRSIKIVKDCWTSFLPLTDIHQSNGCGCTLTASPGFGWEKIFDDIKDHEDARICLPVGVYPLRGPVVFRNKGNIKISGCGPGTIIIAKSAESVFQFEACSSVSVKDLYAESGVSGSGSRSGLIYLNGTLTFSACSKVDVESVELKCASGAERAASCITVRDAASYARSGTRRQVVPVKLARIRNCDLSIGHLQLGILLVNIQRIHVEGNCLNVDEKPGTLSLKTLLQNKRYRSSIRHMMIHDSRLVGEGGTVTVSSPGIVRYTFGKSSIEFGTDPALVSAWNSWNEAHPPKGVQNNRDLLLHMIKIADRVLLNSGVLKDGEALFNGFKGWYDQLTKADKSTAHQGIVVGGIEAGEVNIRNNSIDRVLQGIHVGLNHRDTRTGSQATSGMVHISDNNINVQLTPTSREREGIFVGNCSSLIVQNNFINVIRYAATKDLSTDGILVRGHIGKMAIVRQNHVVDATVAVRFKPLNAKVGKPTWIVADNWPSDA